jgi:hypothetical protein
LDSSGKIAGVVEKLKTVILKNAGLYAEKYEDEFQVRFITRHNETRFAQFHSHVWILTEVYRHVHPRCLDATY